MSVYFDKVKKRWRFEFKRIVPGKRVRATKLLPEGWTRAQAEAFDEKETARLFALATGSGSKERHTIEEAVKVSIEHHYPSLKDGVRRAQELMRIYWAYEGRLIDELAEVAREYATKEKDRLKPATIRNRIAYLRAACRYAFLNHGMAEHDPAERLVMPTVKNERHFYADRREVLRIARSIRKQHPARIAVLIAFYSGMRLAEILRCRVERGAFVLEDTKNGERRVIPIHSKIARYVHRLPLEIKPRVLEWQFKQARKHCGLNHLHFHDLRHSAASEMINNGVDLFTVGVILGHKDPASTQRYSHLTSHTLKNAIGAIGKKSHTKTSSG